MRTPTEEGEAVGLIFKQPGDCNKCVAFAQNEIPIALLSGWSDATAIFRVVEMLREIQGVCSCAWVLARGKHTRQLVPLIRMDGSRNGLHATLFMGRGNSPYSAAQFGVRELHMHYEQPSEEVENAIKQGVVHELGGPDAWVKEDVRRQVREQERLLGEERERAQAEARKRTEPLYDEIFKAAHARRRSADPLGFYATLGIEPDADLKTAVEAYKRKALELHPDKNKSADASEMMKKLTEAFRNIKDSNARSIYDRTGKASASGGFSSNKRGRKGYVTITIAKGNVA